MNATAPRHLPYKSVAIALILSVMLGPIGLLYASFWGGILLLLIGAFIIHSHVYMLALLLWIGCCIWSVRAVESYNQKLWQRHFVTVSNFTK